VKELLWRCYDPLRDVFCFYGSQNGSLALLGNAKLLPYFCDLH
jgi:hypothetical protein